jgi:hypothetical protein
MRVNVSRPRKAKWAVLTAVTALALAAATVGVTFGAFAGQTAAAGNNITAMPDFRGPTISETAIGKSAGFATGYIRTGAVYRIYASVTDVGTPPSGVATVTANVNNVTTGQTAVAMVAGSYTVGGKTYNYRSAQLTAGTLPNGPLGFTISATDAAGNASSTNGNVTVDSTAPAASNISASGGVAGRPEIGDVLTLTTTEALDTFRILSTWDGTATTVRVNFLNNAGGDRVEIRDSTGATILPFGTINLTRTDFVTATVTFSAATMTQVNNAITITLGGTITGTPGTAGGNGQMVWTPSATATDRAGNAMPTTAFNEPNPNDRDF